MPVNKFKSNYSQPVSILTDSALKFDINDNDNQIKK
jgi:hypothetical protein